MSESFYTSSSPMPPPHTSMPLTSPSGAPPPPPPKPTQSADQSRTSTPQQYSSTQSPRPQPPLPTSTSNPQQFQTTTHHQQAPHNPIPPPQHSDHWLPPSLPSHTISDLQSLLSNPTLLTSLAQSHPSYASSLEPLESLLQSNLALAKQLQQTEAQVKSLRDQTAQLLLQHTSLQTQWRRKQSEMDDALSPWGPRNMYQRLVSSIGEQEALLKAMTESFLEGGSGGDVSVDGSGKASEKEVTEWIRRIRDGTATLDKRREMRARWDEGRVGGWR